MCPQGIHSLLITSLQGWQLKLKKCPLLTMSMMCVCTRGGEQTSRWHERFKYLSLYVVLSVDLINLLLSLYFHMLNAIMIISQKYARYICKCTSTLHMKSIQFTEDERRIILLFLVSNEWCRENKMHHSLVSFDKGEGKTTNYINTHYNLCP